MRDARRDEDWQHTARLLAMIHNVNATKTSDLRDDRHFHPYSDRAYEPDQAPPPSPNQRAALREMFPGKRKAESGKRKKP